MDKLYSLGYTVDNNLQDNINVYYKNNEKKFRFLEQSFYENFSIPKHIIKDQIKYILSFSIEDREKNVNKDYLYLHYYNKVKMFFYYYGVMCYFLWNSLFGESKKENKPVDIIFEYGYEPFYRIIFSRLKKYKTATIVFSKLVGNLNILYDNANEIFFSQSALNNKYLKSISFKIFKKQFSKYFFYNKLSNDIGIDIVTIALKLIKQIAVHTTEMNGIKAKVLLSANCNAYGGLKYYIYKKNIVNLMIIENGVIITKSPLSNGESFTYCDYYFGISSNKDNVEINCPVFKHWGSFILANTLYENNLNGISFNKEYDIVFMEQFIMINSDELDIDYYILSLNFLAKFSKKNPNYKVAYRVRTRRDDKMEAEKKKFAKIYDSIIENSNIVLDEDLSNNSYDAVLKSNIVVFYSSSIGIEALGIGKNILSINFNKKHFCKLTEEDSIGMLYEKSYELFENKLLFLLDINNKKKIDTYYQKMKKLYINQKPDLIDRICNIIEKEVNK